MIVDAPRDNMISESLSFPQIDIPSESIPLNDSGSLIKFIIAAKFNHNDPSGWPILQIRRRGNVTAMTQLEPRPTGYLNVFEFEPLSADIQPGDVVCIKSSGPRYLLAYQREPSSKPLVYINVSNDSTVVTSPPTAIATTKLVSSHTFRSTTDLSVSSTETSQDPATAIVGGVLGTLVVFAVFILLVVLIIIVFLIHRHKRNMKQFSPNTAGMPAHNGLDALDNATYAPDSILPDSDQMMLSTRGSEGDRTVATGRGAGAASSSHNNPQEVSSYVYVFIKINTQAL